MFNQIFSHNFIPFYRCYLYVYLDSLDGVMLVCMLLLLWMRREMQSPISFCSRSSTSQLSKLKRRDVIHGLRFRWFYKPQNSDPFKKSLFFSDLDLFKMLHLKKIVLCNLKTLYQSATMSLKQGPEPEKVAMFSQRLYLKSFIEKVCYSLDLKHNTAARKTVIKG